MTLSQYAPFKPGHKGTHAERARALGLEAPALKILNGQSFGLESFINPSKKGEQCLFVWALLFSLVKI